MKILIVTKLSKYEWERKNFNLSHSQFIDKYKSVHANLDSALIAHRRQVYIRDLFKSALPNAYMISMDILDGDIAGYDLVISLGGDDSFKFISHYIDKTPILSINSDPERSDGCLTSYSIVDDKSVFDLKESLDTHNFEIDKWSRLKVSLDGKIIIPAISEYFLGDSRRTKMSCHTLIYKGKEYKQKCSGVIVSTGAGSTGWLQSASGTIPVQSWNPSEKFAAFIITEPYTRENKWEDGHNYGMFGPGEEIIIRSLNNEGGIISVDSWDEYEFIRGSEAKISLGESLNFVRLL